MAGLIGAPTGVEILHLFLAAFSFRTTATTSTSSEASSRWGRHSCLFSLNGGGADDDDEEEEEEVGETDQVAMGVIGTGEEEKVSSNSLCSCIMIRPSQT